MKKVLNLFLQIDFIALLLYITSLFIVAVFSGLEVKSFDVIETKVDSLRILINQNYEGESIEIKKVFYINVNKDNQIVAFRSDSGRYIYVPSFMSNYRVIVKSICYGSAILFVICIFVTFGLIINIAKERSLGNNKEVI